MPRKTKKQKLLEQEILNNTAGAMAIAGSHELAGRALGANFDDPGGSSIFEHLNPKDFVTPLDQQIANSKKRSGGAVDIAGAVDIGGNVGKDFLKGLGKVGKDVILPTIIHSIPELLEAAAEAGSVNIAGAMDSDDDDPNFDPSSLRNRSAKHFWESIEDMDDSEFYHWVLNLNASEWEAIREAANQLIGGNASSMWSHHNLKPQNSKLKTSMHHYRDILLTPNKGAAARMLELDHDTKGSGFKSALKHSVRGAKKIFKKVNRAAPKAIAKGAEVIGKIGQGAKKAAEIVDAAVKIPEVQKALGESGKQLQEGLKGVHEGVNESAPILAKAKNLKHKKSLTKELKKASKAAIADPNKTVDTIKNIQDAYKEGGDKVGKKIISGISATSKAIEKQEQPQSGMNQAPSAALEQDSNMAGGYKKSVMLDPRKCR